MYRRNDYGKSKKFSGVECGGCTFKSGTYCWGQCPYNILKANFYEQVPKVLQALKCIPQIAEAYVTKRSSLRCRSSPKSKA